ncbi:hypothetical protein I307_03858 [Cryptococcus deuterogattii 99/473]|uniref:Sde2 N-terminal ubiquitin domain-containing protein n=1 Tax=Cryptococcus deuterogattii Ram5 TaxID=1296110 RepID=A0A0D0UYT9_9TREE|nr:hypothetical protein I313_06240 [Cryptococcus deuterogattii Ram5]KIY56750.1 hypothetical protein I307_03858 [Cryptococcus deuterogattii 99/473]
MTIQTVFLIFPSPLNSLQIQLPLTTLISSLPVPSALASTSYLRTTRSGPLSPCTPLSELIHEDAPNHPITLHVTPRLLGGKGGFGSQLRAAGGRMSSGKATNVDSCRDLSGRRLGTIKEAQRQAELLESEPALRAQAQAAEKAKLEALERKLGINAAESSEDGSKRKIEDVDLAELARKKHKFEDNKFLEESREINDNVRSAVSAALLLKKKKKKEKEAKTGGGEKGKEKVVVDEKAEQVKKAEKDRLDMPPPVTAGAATTA